MGLLEQEIKEIRSSIRQFKAGKITERNFMVELAAYSQIEKRAKLKLQAHALAAKYKKPAFDQLLRSNLIGTEAIDTLTDPEIEMVKCPAKDDKLITRSDCLDYSGGQKDEECAGCMAGVDTKRVLLGQV